VGPPRPAGRRPPGVARRRCVGWSRCAALRHRPRGVGHGRGPPAGAAARLPPRARRRVAGPVCRAPGHPQRLTVRRGPGCGPGGPRRLGAHHRRNDALRPPPRRCRSGGPRGAGRRPRGDGHGIRDRTWHAADGRRDGIPGVHAIRTGLARARGAGAGTRAESAARADRRALRRVADRAGGAAAHWRRSSGSRALGNLSEGGGRGLRRAPRPTGSRRDVTAVRGAQVRRGAPAHPAGRPGRNSGGRQLGCGGVHHRAGLARVLRRRAVAPPGVGLGGPATDDRDDL
jgi:hypothetical protein